MKQLSLLPNDVIDKIAAGEIIHSPVQVVKELLENSLDANATTITIIVKDGGLSRITISDDGNGISKDDLPQLCHRFTTSKISTFNDLQHLSTFGFRGEALASISYASRLYVSSKTKSSPIGYKAEFRNGQILDSSIKPIATNFGTQFIIEDLFYNCPQRRSTLKSPNEEYLRILRLIQLYSIDKAGISICLKSDGNRSFDVSSQHNISILENISNIFSENIAQQLIFKQDEIDFPSMKYEIYFSNPNFHMKKLEFILFVNGRLVENKYLRKAFSDFYSTILLKQTHPFIYLRLTVDSQNIDVNIHPTKNEILLLHEADIIKRLVNILADNISSSGRLKVFELLTSTEKSPVTLKYKISSPVTKQTPTSSPMSKVRTDPTSPSLLRSFITKTPHTTLLSNIVKRPFLDSDLESIHFLLSQFAAEVDIELKNKLKNLCFVGILNSHNSLFQLDTGLFMLNHSNFFFEYFYVFILKNISCLSMFELDKSRHINMSSLKGMFKNSTSSFTDARDMLEDYFSLRISSDGIISGVPFIINNLPLEYYDIDQIIVTLLSFSEINWDDENECLSVISRSLSYFVSSNTIPKLVSLDISGQTLQPGQLFFETHLVPLLKDNIFFPSKQLSLNSSSFFKLTDLKELYKIFERC